MYEKEYLTTRSKQAFTELMKVNYKHLKDSTIERRYYDCRKELGEQPKYKYLPENKLKPNQLKMITFNDMKNYNNTINREVLQRYGFLEQEMNWLEDEELIKEERQ